MCLNCNEDGYDKRFKIKGRGYGSVFDQDDIEICLCKRCIRKLNLKKEWFKNKRNKNGIYEYEDELEALINEIGLDKLSLTNVCSGNIIIIQ